MEADSNGFGPGGVDFRTARYHRFCESLYPFQREVLERCIQHNSILCLPTGAGKTVVAAALAARFSLTDPNKKIIFVVNRVPLVSQQATVLRRINGFSVAEVCGDRKDCDSFDDLFLRNYDAAVVIEALFHLWLLKEPTVLERTSLLVLDEIHHARKEAFYAKILSKVHDCVSEEAPHILGLSASPAAREDAVKTRRALEQLMGLARARLVTVQEEQQDLVDKVSLPDPFLCEYSFGTAEKKLDQLLRVFLDAIGRSVPMWCENEVLRRGAKHLECLVSLPYGCSQTVFEAKRVSQLAINDDIEGLRALANILVAVHEAIMINEESSIKEAVQRIAIECIDDLEFPNNVDRWRRNYDVEHLWAWHIHPYVTPLVEGLHKFLSMYSLSPAMNNATKVLFLMRLLQNEYENGIPDDFRGIVFCATKQATSKIVDRLNESPLGRVLRPRAFVGHGRTVITTSSSGSVTFKSMSMSEKQQRDALLAFRRGDTKLLIATSVAEEGLDIPSCSLVVRYEGQFTVQSFIQSRGRARRRDSKFFVITKQTAANPFMDVLDNIRLQEQVISEIVKLDNDEQDLIVHRNRIGNRSFYDYDPLHYLSAFARKHSVDIESHEKYVQGGYQISYILQTHGRIFEGVGIGTQKKARNIAMKNLCRELEVCGLLTKEVTNGCDAKPLTDVYTYHNANSSLATTRKQEVKAPDDEPKPFVLQYDRLEWQQTSPFVVLNRVLHEKSLPQPMVIEESDDRTQQHKVELFVPIFQNGQLMYAMASHTASTREEALQTAAMQGLRALGTNIIKRSQIPTHSAIP
jgi:ERCC4-related helicase